MAKQESTIALAAKGIVAGKQLKEWIDAPYGAFAQAVRETMDPFYMLEEGQDPEELKFTVKVRYSYVPEPEVEYATKTYEVLALTPEAAKEKAEELFEDDGDLESGEDHSITSVCEPQLVQTNEGGKP